jgi:hypothetical protein
LGNLAMRNLISLVGALALVSCAGQAPAPVKMLWLRADGQDDPVLARQFETDRTVCMGERRKANVTVVPIASGGVAGVIATQERPETVDDVAKGCMAEKGYLLVPETEVEAKRQELATIAAEKNAPPPPPAPPAPPARKR